MKIVWNKKSGLLNSIYVGLSGFPLHDLIETVLFHKNVIMTDVKKKEEISMKESLAFVVHSPYFAFIYVYSMQMNNLNKFFKSTRFIFIIIIDI